jgi:hypothetical protein
VVFKFKDSLEQYEIEVKKHKGKDKCQEGSLRLGATKVMNLLNLF